MANKAYNFNDNIYLSVGNDNFVIEQKGDPESAEYVGTISRTDVIPPAHTEIPADDVIVLAALSNVAGFCDNLMESLV